MFYETSFNVDLSKWDVSSVTNMAYMFFHAASFNQKLCGADWVSSKASKRNMFGGSSGSISNIVCTIASKAFWSTAALKDAVSLCRKEYPRGDCASGAHGLIAEWDVSSVT